MGNKSSLIVRLTDKKTAEFVVDVRVFPLEQEDQAIGFALDIFRACSEVCVMVFSEEKDSNIISLFR